MPWHEAVGKEGYDVLLTMVKTGTVESRPHSKLAPGHGIPYPQNLEVRYTREKDTHTKGTDNYTTHRGHRASLRILRDTLAGQEVEHDTGSGGTTILGHLGFCLIERIWAWWIPASRDDSGGTTLGRGDPRPCCRGSHQEGPQRLGPEQKGVAQHHKSIESEREHEGLQVRVGFARLHHRGRC